MMHNSGRALLAVTNLFELLGATLPLPQSYRVVSSSMLSVWPDVLTRKVRS